MPIAVTMPRMNDTMEDGTLLKWHVKEGDKVSSGDELADIETDKATQVLTSYEDGQVALINVKEGEMAKVGQAILVVAESGESVEDAVSKAKELGMLEMPAAAEETPAKENAQVPTPVSPPPAPAAPKTTAPAPVTVQQTMANGAASIGPVGRLRVSPVARKIAEENGIDLFLLQGSGPDGRIIKRDVQTAVAKGTARLTAPVAPQSPTETPKAAKASKPKGFQLPSPQPLVAETRQITGRRKTIARRLLDSKQQIPHFTVSMEVDAEPIEIIRKQINTALAAQGIRLSVNDFVMKGTAQALMRHPLINSSWSDHGIVTYDAVNIGVAVAIPEESGGGLVVPVIRDAHIKPLKDISSETKSLAKKSRAAGLSPEEMAGGTFTVSNLGMFGVDHFEAIINPPQAAILAIGAAIDKPVVKDGAVVPGKRMTLTLSADHRVIDGAMAAEFLQSLKYLLENPAAALV